MKPRCILNQLIDHSMEKEITLLIGARQTGKTTLLKQIDSHLTKRGETTAFFSLEDKMYLNAFNEHPKNLFQFIPLSDSDRTNFVFIDEVQYLQDPSNFLKLIYDEYAPQLKLIVSGSSSFYIDKKFKDSLAGRKQIFYLPTMGFREFLYFRDYENIMNYVHSDFLPKLYFNDLRALFAEYLLYGGYPKVVTVSSVKRKKAVLKELATSYVKKDINEASIQYPEIYFKILKIVAGQTGHLLNPNSISKSLQIQNKTVELYLYVMQKSFHIGLVKPFYRSAVTELRKMKKAYFYDLGLRNFFAGNFDPILLRNDRGELLENYVYCLFADSYDTDWDIKYWRTQKKQEVDFIIQEKWAYEVKFSDKLFKQYKYRFFKNKYPDISLELLTYDNIIEFNPVKEKLHE
ncbi:MAG: ATP-binding protein [Candidatus Marinimicrobia bacterium]|nr:ATP-binding protein [Candidatus Neomarinimicrobiota bacterium]